MKSNGDEFNRVEAGEKRTNVDQIFKNKASDDNESSNTGLDCRDIFTNILLGPGHAEITNLLCVNTVYLIFIFSFTSTSISLHFPGLNNLIVCPKDTFTTTTDCGGFVSTGSIVLRLGFSLTSTFTLLAVLSWRGNNWRGKIHQGFWVIKFLLILATLMFALWIPFGAFDVFWGMTSFSGSLIFHVYETIIILDVATYLSNAIVLKIGNNHSRTWYFVWLLGIWSIYGTLFVTSVFLYMTFLDHCPIGLVLLSIVLIYSVLVACFVVYFNHKRASLFHSGFISIFVYIVMFTALENDEKCRPLKSTAWGNFFKIVKTFDIIQGFFMLAYLARRHADAKYYHHANGILSNELRVQLLPSDKQCDDGSHDNDKFTPAKEQVFNPIIFFVVMALFCLQMTSNAATFGQPHHNSVYFGNAAMVNLKSLSILFIFVTAIWLQIFPEVYPTDDPTDITIAFKRLAVCIILKLHRIFIEGCAIFNGSKTSRIIFTIFYVLGLTFSCIMYIPAVRRRLSTTHYFCPESSPLGTCLSTDPAYMAVYRICFAMASFYLFYAVILIRVTDVRGTHVDRTQEGNTSNVNTIDDSPRDNHEEVTRELCMGEHTRGSRVDSTRISISDERHREISRVDEINCQANGTARDGAVASTRVETTRADNRRNSTMNQCHSEENYCKMENTSNGVEDKNWRDDHEHKPTRECRVNDDTRDSRVDLQHKAWPVKFCFFFSLLFCSFFLPNEFSRVWIYLALVGTFMFTVLQLCLLINWANCTRRRLEEKMNAHEESLWGIFSALTTLVLFAVCIITVTLFYIYFTHLPSCLTNVIFITLNVVLAVVASVVSVHPKIYDAGLFQCAVIIVFSLYLTWSALSHNPDESCNPLAGYIAEVDMRPNLNIQAGVDLIFTVITLVYFSYNVARITEHMRTFYDKLRGDREGTLVSPNNPDYPSYNFTLFHTVYFLACLHATIILTNWFIPAQGSHFKLSVNWAAMCVKMTASCLSLLIYTWCISVQLFVNKQ